MPRWGETDSVNMTMQHLSREPFNCHSIISLGMSCFMQMVDNYITPQHSRG